MMKYIFDEEEEEEEYVSREYYLAELLSNSLIDQGPIQTLHELNQFYSILQTREERENKV